VAACTIFSEGEEGLHFVHRLVIQEIREDTGVLFGRFLDDIGGITRCKQAHVETAFAFGKRERSKLDCDLASRARKKLSERISDHGQLQGKLSTRR
jgi:hypothetical protein